MLLGGGGPLGSDQVMIAEPSMDGVSDLVIEALERSLAPSDMYSAGVLILNFLHFRILRNKFLLF